MLKGSQFLTLPNKKKNRQKKKTNNKQKKKTSDDIKQKSLVRDWSCKQLL